MIAARTVRLTACKLCSKTICMSVSISACVNPAHVYARSEITPRH